MPTLSPTVAREKLHHQWGLRLLIMAFFFVGFNSIGLMWAKSEKLDWSYLQPFVVWVVTITVATKLLNRYRPSYDQILYAIYALLTGWGLVLQTRLSPAFTNRHQIWFVLGTAVLLFITIRTTALWPLRTYRYSLLLFGIALMIATFIFGENPSGQGLQFWLQIPILNIYFQPSELLKLLLVIFFSSYFAEKSRLILTNQQQGTLHTLPYLAPIGIMFGVCIGFVVWQQDLGAATILFALFLTMLYLATGNRKLVVFGLALLFFAGGLAYQLFDVVALRFDAWINPWPEFDGRSYQIVQALYAFAEGHIFGQGVGQGYPTFIPVVHSDFVFSAIGEEWGLIGTIACTICFAVLVQRGLRIALNARGQDEIGRIFTRFLATGISALFGIQALLIMGGATKLLPLTGITLPFVSYGGSSFLIASTMMGLLLYLSCRNREYQAKLDEAR